LKQFPEYSESDKIMKGDPLLSKHVGTLVSSGMSGARMDSSMYIFYILDESIGKFYLSGNKFDEILFTSLYCDLQFLFYNDDIPFKVIAPLHHFASNVNVIDLKEGLRIRKITKEERKSFSRLGEGLGLTWTHLAELEYTIEYSFREKKTIGDSARISVNETAMNLLKKLIIVMRLFKDGSIGYSSTIWKPILKTAQRRRYIVVNCLSCVITLGNFAVNLKLSGVHLAQFLTLNSLGIL
jgi:hypothetical protein